MLPHPLFQGSDVGSAVLPVKHRRAGHKNVHASGLQVVDGLQIHPAVHFEQNLRTTLIDGLPAPADFGKHAGDELLAAKPWIHGHQEHHVHVAEDILDAHQWCGRVQDHGSLRRRVP